MTLNIITAEGAPPAVGPYSHAVVNNGVSYISGCLALDENANFLGGDAAAQAAKAFSNLELVLKASGASKTSVMKVVVFLTDMADFPAVNAVYTEFFGDYKPARSCVAVAQLPLGATVEIEAIASVIDPA